MGRRLGLADLARTDGSIRHPRHRDVCEEALSQATASCGCSRECDRVDAATRLAGCRSLAVDGRGLMGRVNHLLAPFSYWQGLDP